MMPSNLDRMKKDFEELIEQSEIVRLSLVKTLISKDEFRNKMKHNSDKIFDEFYKALPAFKEYYESWYSKCIIVLKQLLPDRLDHFVRQYEKPKNRKTLDVETYSIQDYMLNIKVVRGATEIVGMSSALPRLENQIAILRAAEGRFDNSLFEMRQLMQADLFDSELDAASALLKQKFLRASGVVAGVVLERHLAQVCADHGIVVREKNPTIGIFNEALKKQGTIDLPQYRHIGLLGDIRNICGHNKTVEPTESNVLDMIDGVTKIVKTIQ